MVGLLVASAVSRGAAQQQTPTFRATTDLLTLDVTVVDRDGRPVEGLAADDFTVTVDGHPKPVRIVEFLRFGRVEADTAAQSAGTPVTSASNQDTDAVKASRGGRVIVLLFDDLSIRVGEAKGLLVAAERALRSFSQDDLVGLTTTSGFGPVVMPTRDRGALLAALRDKRLIGQMPSSEGGHQVTVREAVRYAYGPERPSEVLAGVAGRECGSELTAVPYGCPDRVEALLKSLASQVRHRAVAQVDGYLSVLAALAEAPQPRVLLLLSGGLPIEAGTDGRRHIDRLTRAAASSGVQVYSLFEEPEMVDIRDVSQPPTRSSPVYSARGARQAEGAFLFDGMQSMARAVGGTAFRVVGQADRFVSRVLSETSAAYRLGVEVVPWPGGSRPLPLRVTVAKPDHTVRAMANVLRPSGPPPTVPPRRALAQRLAQGGVAFGVPMSVGATMRRETANGARRQILVEVQAPAVVPAPLLFGFALLDSDGAVTQSGWREVRASGPGEYRFTFPLPLRPGVHRLRVAMADANGSVGSVDRAIPGDVARLGDVPASDLLLSWSGAGQPVRLLATDTLPVEAESVGASIEIYTYRSEDAGRGAVRFELIGPDETVVFTDDVIPAAAGDRLSASVSLDVAALAPGVYTLRARWADDHLAAAVVAAVIRKR